MRTIMANPERLSPGPLRRQRGAILVTSLLLLLVLTVLGVTMMKMTNMQERMAGNTRDISLALQGAEAALRDGERILDPFMPAIAGVSLLPTGALSCMVCQPGALPLDIANPGAFDWNANGQQYGDDGVQEFPGLAEDPQFKVTEIAFIEDSYLNGQDYFEDGRSFYQVTAHSSGASGLANVVLQSTYARPR
jgi:type IV pilus assembly protein PilX